MLYHAAAAGAFDLRKAVMESLQAFQRAGECVGWELVRIL